MRYVLLELSVTDDLIVMMYSAWWFVYIILCEYIASILKRGGSISPKFSHS